MRAFDGRLWAMTGDGTDSTARMFHVEHSRAGQRLDVYLAEMLAISRLAAKRLLQGEWVFVDGRAAKLPEKGLILRGGEVIEVRDMSAGQEQPVPQPDLPLAVLARGEGWVAVDKPAGMPVHPLRADETGTVLNAAVARWPRIMGIGEGALRSGVVHRLDVDTSGVLLLAVQQDVWISLRKAFSTHTSRKIYHAIVLGQPGDRGREVVYLKVARHKPARVKAIDAAKAAGDKDARRCNLSWNALEQFADAALVEVSLGTGFLHQIRATFAHRGHPLAGDALYADASRFDRTGAQRQMLHATSIVAGDARAQSPYPPDFQSVLERLRQSGHTR